MDVVRSDCAGFCYGVKRALDIVLSVSDGAKSVQTLGALIHNPTVVSQLEARGVSVAKCVEDVAGDVVVIRSHGVTPDIADELARTGAEVVDATCPHVLRAQKAAHKLSSEGMRVLIVGEEGHPEVDGLLAWAKRGGSDAFVVGCGEDVPADLKGPVGIVVQTTQITRCLEEVCDALDERGVSYELCNTICSATSERQDAASSLATSVDAMVVVGGKNSSNTMRLFEICQKAAPVAFHVESAAELQCSWFSGMERVGVTAGASTPDDQIEQVVECLLAW